MVKEKPMTLSIFSSPCAQKSPFLEGRTHICLSHRPYVCTNTLDGKCTEWKYPIDCPPFPRALASQTLHFCHHSHHRSVTGNRSSQHFCSFNSSCFSKAFSYQTRLPGWKNSKPVIFLHVNVYICIHAIIFHILISLLLLKMNVSCCVITQLLPRDFFMKLLLILLPKMECAANNHLLKSSDF